MKGIKKNSIKDKKRTCISSIVIYFVPCLNQSGNIGRQPFKNMF